MTLPSTLRTNNEWTIIGPMGPDIPSQLESFPVLAVDGGAHFTSRVDIWVGDADSYDKEVLSSHVHKHPKIKDKSDLALALELFTAPIHYKLHMWGLLGGRKDHELFNLGECLAFLQTRPECQVLFYGDNFKVSYQLLGAGHWKFSYLGLFSIGVLNTTTLKLNGECEYPIKKSRAIYPLSSFGLSNIGKGEMTLENDGPLFIYYPEGE